MFKTLARFENLKGKKTEILLIQCNASYIVQWHCGNARISKMFNEDYKKAVEHYNTLVRVELQYIK